MHFYLMAGFIFALENDDKKNALNDTYILKASTGKYVQTQTRVKSIVNEKNHQR